MNTVNQIITRAFQSAGITRVGGTVPGKDTTFALDLTNEMLDKWRSGGITHGLSDVTTSTEVYDGSLISCLRKNLTVALLDGPYEGQPSPMQVREAIDELNKLMPWDTELSYDDALGVRHIDSVRVDSE